MRKHIRRILFFMLSIMLMFAGCAPKQNNDDQQVAQLHNFSGRVERLADGSVLVQPVAGSNEAKCANLIWVSVEGNDIRVGDWVQVSYDGMIQETYPAKIPNVYAVGMEKRVLTDELQDEILTELSWDNVEFFDFTQLNGVAYIGCKNGDDIGFVVLLKGDSGYTLEEVYKQTEKDFQVFTGVMESRTVYLVTDPDIYALEPVNDSYDSIAIYNYPALIVPAVDTEFEPARNE